jgi:hypothetical protein
MNSEKQEQLRKFVNTEIIYNQSYLVDKLFNDAVFDYADVSNIYDEDTEEYKEIFEWWIVSDWMANKLEEKGESILKNDYGTWWGRSCTGQSIILDYVIERIYDDLNKI